MANMHTLLEQLQQHFQERIVDHCIYREELTIEVAASEILSVCYDLRDEEPFKFDMLIDLCGVDYLLYGRDEWRTDKATFTGFSRGVNPFADSMPEHYHPRARYAVVYHLLSIKKNQRLRLKTFVEGEPPLIDSIIDVWEAANWYEREAFDLYGILFKGHPDLRRILTDYGFIGHPFRKDFPMIGNVEMRYDATMGRCIYEPVGIRPRTLVPKVIREDHRYIVELEEEDNTHG